MNNDDILMQLCYQSGVSKEEAAKMMDTLPEVIKGFCKELDTVAIPGFGTISSVKTEEQIVRDPVSDTNIMLPPSIDVRFKSSVVLRKRFVG